MCFDLDLRRSQERVIWLWFWKHGFLFCFVFPLLNKWSSVVKESPPPIWESRQIASGPCALQVEVRSRQILTNAHLVGTSISPFSPVSSLIFINANKCPVFPQAPIFATVHYSHGGVPTNCWLFLLMFLWLLCRVAPSGEVTMPRMGFLSYSCSSCAVFPLHEFAIITFIEPTFFQKEAPWCVLQEDSPFTRA